VSETKFVGALISDMTFETLALKLFVGHETYDDECRQTKVSGTPLMELKGASGIADRVPL
jgi:hypothetical protein